MRKVTGKGGKRATLRAYEVGVKGTEWSRVVHHVSAAKAKYAYYRDVREPWPDLRFQDLTCRALGSPVQTEKFQHTANYSGVDFRIGDEVEVCGESGVLVDSNSMANFDVLFLTGKYKGQTLNCHPAEISRAAVRP